MNTHRDSLCRPQVRVQRHDDGTRCHGSIVRNYELGTVPKADGDPVARAYAQFHEAYGTLSRTPSKFSVGEPRVAEITAANEGATSPAAEEGQSVSYAPLHLA